MHKKINIVAVVTKYLNNYLIYHNFVNFAKKNKDRKRADFAKSYTKY